MLPDRNATDPVGSTCQRPSNPASDIADEKLAAVILAGGASRRMGQAKAGLIWQGQTFLQRICATVQKLAGQVVAVGPQGMEEPPAEWCCPRTVVWTADSDAHAGPVVGLANGLAKLPCSANRTLLLGCDCPGVSTLVLKRLVAELDGLGTEWDGIVIADRSGRIGLLSIWRLSILERLESSINQGERRFQSLPQEFSCRTLTQESFAAADPEFYSFANINTAEDYERLLKLPVKPG